MSGRSSGPADCPVGSFCVPPSYLAGTGTRCVPQTECCPDADCGGSVCALAVNSPTQAGVPSLLGTRCVPNASASRMRFSGNAR
jgi:hypothetical protein